MCLLHSKDSESHSLALNWDENEVQTIKGCRLSGKRFVLLPRKWFFLILNKNIFFKVVKNIKILFIY
jgi:hypothetical protein